MVIYKYLIECRVFPDWKNQVFLPLEYHGKTWQKWVWVWVFSITENAELLQNGKKHGKTGRQWMTWRCRV